MNRRVTEKEWAKTVRQLAKVYGWRAYHTKFSIGSDPGYPDDHYWHPRPPRGAFVEQVVLDTGMYEFSVTAAFLAEYKKESGKTTDAQDECIQSLRSAGYTVYVWRPSDWPSVVEVLSFGRAVGQ